MMMKENNKAVMLDQSPKKKKCQRFTPKEITDEMLQLAGCVKHNNIINKKVLEHSFGTGNILLSIVEEYINNGIIQGYSSKQIADSISKNIYGFELDKELYDKAIIRLQEVLQKYDIPEVKWNLYNQDSLFWEDEVQFDFIIGNPPYITYSEIDHENQNALRQRFKTCSKGKFDYYYAFIEFSISKLSPQGKLVQLVPSSLYKNVYAAKIRELLKEHIKQINIYPGQRLFPDATISTSIFLYDTQEKNDRIICVNKTNNSSCIISRQTLGEKWSLAEEHLVGKRIRFGDCFKASNTIATLLNDAYLLSEDQINSLEQDIIRPAVSPKTLRYNIKKYIIFPYKTNNGKTERFSKEEFETQYPRITKHMRMYSDKLGKRKAGNNIQWFEYGRTQALQFMQKEKLVISTVVTNSVTIYHIDKQTIPFTGILVVSKGEKEELEIAKKILGSKDFMEYVQQIGIPVNGSSIRITSKDINEYMFPEGELHGRTEL